MKFSHEFFLTVSENLKKFIKMGIHFLAPWCPFSLFLPYDTRKKTKKMIVLTKFSFFGPILTSSGSGSGSVLNPNPNPNPNSSKSIYKKIKKSFYIEKDEFGFGFGFGFGTEPEPEPKPELVEIYI